MKIGPAHTDNFDSSDDNSDQDDVEIFRMGHEPSSLKKDPNSPSHGAKNKQFTSTHDADQLADRDSNMSRGMIKDL